MSQTKTQPAVLTDLQVGDVVVKRNLNKDLPGDSVVLSPGRSFSCWLTRSANC